MTVKKLSLCQNKSSIEKFTIINDLNIFFSKIGDDPSTIINSKLININNKSNTLNQ